MSKKKQPLTEALDSIEKLKLSSVVNTSLGSLVGTGIKLRAFDTVTGEPTTTGFQLDNSRMEIMAVSGIKVEVVGYSEMYKALSLVLEATMFEDKLPNKQSDWEQIRKRCVAAIAKAELCLKSGFCPKSKRVAQLESKL